ncbi:RWD domain [Popillia japonica]|uniref:RWD domain n=1 Tax=Popillia japonica TaxID=7064 RepID=A0AAW1HWG8_POPJA
MSEEAQEEEREVLSSIYDGDLSFKQISPTVFQYKFGEHDNSKSFLLEIGWSDKYPDEKPDINMDAFYNKHVSKSLKEKIVKMRSSNLGMSMTYSLFEFIKEKFDELISDQPDDCIVEQDIEKLEICETQDVPSKKVVKKEHLTKAQKRRQWDKVDARGSKEDSAPTS